MTRKKGLEQQNAEIQEQLQQRIAELEARLKPSAFREFWNWSKSHWLKPYIIPFILGMLVGWLSAAACGLPSAVSITQTTTLEQQAATGGAAIPFPNASPLPSPWNSPPGDWIEESAGIPFTRVSDETLPSNPQADNGRANSQGLFPTRLLRRR